MGSFVCTHCSETSHLFGNDALEWATTKNVPLLGSVPLEKQIMTCADQGRPISLTFPDSMATKVSWCVLQLGTFLCSTINDNLR